MAAVRGYADTLFFLFSLVVAQVAFVSAVLLSDAGVAFASNAAQLLSCAGAFSVWDVQGVAFDQ